MAAADLAAEAPVEIGKQTSVIPNWARHFLTEKDLAKIQEAVAHAEKTTTGEIIPIIVRQSSFTGHLPLLLTLVFLVVLLVFEIPRLDLSVVLEFKGAVFLVMVFCFVLACLLAYFLSGLNSVKRWLIPKLDQAAQVDARAELEFYRSGMTSTAGQTGVLLFISLMERRAVVLADRGIASKMPKESWSEICQLMVQAIHQGRTAEGICKGIQRSGELLAQEFPHGEENPDELSNQLILKE